MICFVFRPRRAETLVTTSASASDSTGGFAITVLGPASTSALHFLDSLCFVGDTLGTPSRLAQSTFYIYNKILYFCKIN